MWEKHHALKERYERQEKRRQSQEKYAQSNAEESQNSLSPPYSTCTKSFFLSNDSLQDANQHSVTEPFCELDNQKQEDLIEDADATVKTTYVETHL